MLTQAVSPRASTAPVSLRWRPGVLLGCRSPAGQNALSLLIVRGFLLLLIEVRRIFHLDPQSRPQHVLRVGAVQGLSSHTSPDEGYGQPASSGGNAFHVLDRARSGSGQDRSGTGTAAEGNGQDFSGPRAEPRVTGKTARGHRQDRSGHRQGAVVQRARPAPGRSGPAVSLRVHCLVTAQASRSTVGGQPARAIRLGREGGTHSVPGLARGEPGRGVYRPRCSGLTDGQRQRTSPRASSAVTAAGSFRARWQRCTASRSHPGASPVGGSSATAWLRVRPPRRTLAQAVARSPEHGVVHHPLLPGLRAVVRLVRLPAPPRPRSPSP